MIGALSWLYGSKNVSVGLRVTRSDRKPSAILSQALTSIDLWKVLNFPAGAFTDEFFFLAFPPIFLPPFPPVAAKTPPS